MLELVNPRKPITKKIEPSPGTVERVKKIIIERMLVIARLKISFKNFTCYVCCLIGIIVFLSKFNVSNNNYW